MSLHNICIKSICYPQNFINRKINTNYRIGEKDNPQNYRPILLLPVIIKVFEKLIYARLNCFQVQKNSLNERQYGFGNKQVQLTELQNLLNISGLVFILWMKCAVFSETWQKHLTWLATNFFLLKCERYGLRGCVYHLVKSYLSDRKQFIQIGEKKSAVVDVKYGVPQGSVFDQLFLCCT